MLIRMIVALADDERARRHYDENPRMVFDWFGVTQDQIDRFFAGSTAEQNQVLLDEITQLRQQVSDGQPLFWQGRDMEPLEIQQNPAKAGSPDLVITGNYLPPASRAAVKVVGVGQFTPSQVDNAGKTGSRLVFTAPNIEPGAYTVEIIDTSQGSKAVQVPGILTIE